MINNYGQIHQTVTSYIEGLYEKNIEKLSKTIHLNVFKRQIQSNTIINLDYEKIIRNAGKEKNNELGNDIHSVEVKILETDNYVASVIAIYEYIDILQLLKVGEEWLIVNILSHYNLNFNNDASKIGYIAETKHFIINYYEAEKECIGEVLNLLESSYDRVTKNLCKKLNQKTIVQICSNSSQLHSELNIKNGPDWIRGGIAGGRTIIASPLNPPPGANFYNVLNTVVHEFVHVIINEINKDTPRWLNEGVASYEGKDNSEKWIKKTIKSGLENNKLPMLKDLDTGEDFELFFNRDGYQYSYTITEFIIHKFGYSKLIKLIENPNDLEDIFEMTESEFHCKWVDFLKTDYSKE